MKKISTAAARPSRKISAQKLTVGLDLGDRSSWHCVLDEAGTVLLEQKLSTTAKALQAVFGGTLKIRGQPEASSGCPLLFSHRPSLLIYVKRDPRKIVIRRPDTFIVGRADLNCHQSGSTGGSLIRNASSRD